MITACRSAEPRAQTSDSSFAYRIVRQSLSAAGLLEIARSDWRRSDGRIGLARRQFRIGAASLEIGEMQVARGRGRETCSDVIAVLSSDFRDAS
jgi:hypothetical protein